MSERTVQEGLGHIRLKMKWKATLFAVELRGSEFCYDMLLRNRRPCSLPNLVAPPSTLFLYLTPEFFRIRGRIDTFHCPQRCHRCLQHLLEIFPGESFRDLTAELMSNPQERIGHRTRIVQRQHHRGCQAYNRLVRTGVWDVVQPGFQRRMIRQYQIRELTGLVDKRSKADHERN